MKAQWVKSSFLSLIIIIGLFCANFIIQIGVDPSYKSMSTDSGTFAYCGQVVRDGGLMYRDCWDNKPPGVYYLNAFAIWLAGPNPFAIWLFQAIWLTIAIVVFFLIMNRIWEHKGLAAVASFALLLLTLYPDIFQGGNFTETYTILPAVLSLGAFWAYLVSGRRYWLVAIGILMAAGFLLKPTYIAVGLAATVVVTYLGLRRRAFSSVLADIAMVGFTALIPLGLVGLYWVLKQDFYELWFAVFAHNVTYISQGFSLRSLYGTIRMFLIPQPMAALSILVVMALVAFLVQNGRLIFTNLASHQSESPAYLPGRMKREQVMIWFMAGVFLSTGFDFVFLASSGKNFGHYLQVILPGMVVGMLYLLDSVHRSLYQGHLERNLRMVVLSAVIIVSLGGGLEVVAKELPNMQELKTFFTTKNLTIYQPTELEQYIIDHSSPSDSVLVWAGHPGMNFVTQRRSPTKYIFLLHLFSPTPYGPNGFSEFTQELESDPPELIVIQPVSSMGLPDITNPSTASCTNCDSSLSAGLSELHQLIASRYELSYSIWDWVVYSRLH